MKYRGYEARIEYDDDAKMLLGRVLYIGDVLSFRGSSVPEVEREFHEVIDEYIELCERRGEIPEKPYSGNFIVRVRPDLHRDISKQAHMEKKSLNEWVTGALVDALDKVVWQSRFMTQVQKSYLVHGVSMFEGRLELKPPKFAPLLSEWDKAVPSPVHRAELPKTEVSDDIH